MTLINALENEIAMRRQEYDNLLRSISDDVTGQQRRRAAGGEVGETAGVSLHLGYNLGNRATELVAVATKIEAAQRMLMTVLDMMGGRPATK